jgi:hypothetical protein
MGGLGAPCRARGCGRPPGCATPTAPPPWMHSSAASSECRACACIPPLWAVNSRAGSNLPDRQPAVDRMHAGAEAAPCFSRPGAALLQVGGLHAFAAWCGQSI